MSDIAAALSSVRGRRPSVLQAESAVLGAENVSAAAVESAVMPN
jgi:hypothetical protein